LKTNLLYQISLLFFALFLISFSDPYSIKRISDADFRYEFYTTNKDKKVKTNKTYYWFKGGAIHNTQSGVAGELLHGKFTKMYHSNQLAEEGFFRKGTKRGLWKTWYANGVLETTQYWVSGLKSGLYLHYDQNGKLIEKGRYTNSRKYGKWIDYIKKDTTIYKRGEIYIKKTNNNKTNKETNNNTKLKTSSQTKKQDTLIKKESFFKRLFKKKKTK
jgi:hypothetical protein